MAYLNDQELKQLCLKKLGKNVKISTKASIYNSKYISIGDFSRIDDFCIISAGDGEIEIGCNVHIACHTCIIGQEKIIIEDFAGVSSHSSIYSSTDDYSGNFLTGPTISQEFRNVISKPVTIRKHVIIGAGSVILPGVEIGLGSAVGAMSLVNKKVDPFYIVAGVPIKKIKRRFDKILDLESQYKNEQDSLNNKYKNG